MMPYVQVFISLPCVFTFITVPLGIRAKLQEDLTVLSGLKSQTHTHTLAHAHTYTHTHSFLLDPE
jgi:hypothetical protein